MTTLLITHDAFLDHAVPAGHPERPDRMRAVFKVLEDEKFSGLKREEAPASTAEKAALAHPENFVEAVERAMPSEGIVSLDADTSVSPGSWEAAMRAIGGACRAVDEVLSGTVDNAFCAMRPPGHHSERVKAMGFCIFNHVAVAARHAQREHGLGRVAIMDFDVHHGNGTQDIFWEDGSVLYASTHQMPLYPGTGAVGETGVGNIVNAPLRSGDGGTEFRRAFEERIIPGIERFEPELILISAGFDAHERDPLASLELVEEDFAWATLQLMDLAEKHCGGKLVSVMEGGYDLVGLARSVDAHVTSLMNGAHRT